jgi:hypothetical protein
MVLPGPAGAAGIAGSTGAQGPSGPAVYLEAPEADEPIMFPGIPGSPAPILGFSGGLTASTTINDTTTPTTGGVTLASQVAVTGSVWRIRAHGTFVAVSSGTARNAVAAVFWGSTQLTPTISTAVLASTAQTTNWEMEFIVTASSTTAVWETGYRNDQIGATATFSLKNATPASTTVTAGAQTIDLRFSMSAAVATDQWVVQNVTIERLK